MSGAGSVFAGWLQRRDPTLAAVTEEALSPLLQPRPRLSSPRTDGVPSVVLVGPSPPTPFSLSQQGRSSVGAGGVEGDAKRSGNVPRDKASFLRQREPPAALCAVEMRTPRTEEGAATGQTSPTWTSGCPRSPSMAGGRYEEATEARTGPGYFSPAWVYKSGDATGTGFDAGPSETEEATQVMLQKDLDVFSAFESGEQLRMGADMWPRIPRESSEISAVPSVSHCERLFEDRTNANGVPNGRGKAPLTPLGINKSYHGQQEERRPIQYRKGSSYVSCQRFKQTPQVQLSPPPRPPPSSVGVLEGGRSEEQQTSEPQKNTLRAVTKKHWVLDNDTRHQGEAEEEPVLLSVLLDRGWGKMCEEEAAFWKRRCALAEEQVVVTLRNDDDARSFNTTRRSPQHRVSSTPEAGGPSLVTSIPRHIDDVHTQCTPPTGQPHSVIQQVDVREKGGRKNEMKEEASTKIEGRRFVVLTGEDMANQEEEPTTTADEKNQWVLEEECEQLRKTVARLRSEREDLRRDLETQVARNENLETSLVAKKEQQVAEREEWLSQENKLRARQEKLATALRQVHRNVASVAEQLEQREKDLSASRTRCCALESELAAARMEVLGLKASCAEHLEEGQRLQQQLEQLESELRPCNASMMSTSSNNGSDRTEIYRDGNGNGTALTNALREDTEKRLRAVLLAMHRGESRREWIVSELIDAVKTLRGGDMDEAMLMNVETDLSQLMRLLDGLLKFKLEPSYNVWDFPPVEEERFDGPLSAINDGNSVTDLVIRAQERVSQLSEWASALQRRHSELTEELEVVRADRNELVGRQSKGAQQLQQLLLLAEQEKTRLMVLLGERDETIRRLKEEWSSASDAFKKSATKSTEGPFLATDATAEEGTGALHEMRSCYFERLILHIGQQTDMFVNSLQTLLMETLEAVAQARGDHVVRAEWRDTAPPGQPQSRCGEREVSRRSQDESLDALRSELKSVRMELAEKESALQTLLRFQMRQGETSHQKLRNETILKTPGPLVDPPASFFRVVTSSPLLGDGKRVGDTFMDPASEPPNAALLHEDAARAVDDAILHFHGANQMGAGRGTPSSFAPAAVSAHGGQKQLRHLCSYSQHIPESQCHPLSSPGEMASSSLSSSSCFSNLPPNEATDEHHSYSYTVQKGVMRKHQEVWMRQAEIMGIVPDVNQCGESPYRTTPLQTEKSCLSLS